MCVAQGFDGSGLIRILASFCGVYGLKPSFGRVPSVRRPDGFVQDRPFVDLGPLTRYVADAALMLDVAAGAHPRDPFSLPDEPDSFLAATERPADDLRVGYVPDLDVFTVDSEVESLVGDAVDALKNAGATVERTEVGFEQSFEKLRDLHWTMNVGKRLRSGKRSNASTGSMSSASTATRSPSTSLAESRKPSK